MGAKGLLSNPKYRQLKQHGEITTPTPDLRDLSPLPKPSGREASYLPSSVSLQPYFPAQTPAKASPAPHKDLGRNFRRRRPASPSAGAPRRQLAPSSRNLSEQGPAGAARGLPAGKGPREGEGAEGRGTHPGSGSRRPPRGGAGAARRPAWRGGSARLRAGAVRTPPHAPSAPPPPVCPGSQGAGGREGGDPTERRCRTAAVTPPWPFPGCPAGGTAPPPQRPPAPAPLLARLPPFPGARLGPSRRGVLVCPPAVCPPAGRGCLLRARGLRAFPRVSPGGGMRGIAPRPLMSENAFIVAR